VSTDRTQEGKEGAKPKPVIIKKYANRRLYNTGTSAYVTLENLSEMVHKGIDFEVQDARTNEDITRSVLAQIIFEQENRGQNLLPVQFLRNLIRFYGDQVQGFLPAYLEMSMETFARNREMLREQMGRAFGGAMPMQAFEEQARQNMQLFEQAMRLWQPFSPLSTGAVQPAQPTHAKPAEPEALDELRRQMEAMQKQLDAISGARKPGA
jgi:polyhydroxyalkanoate synthesis repressor PhaR